MKFSFVPLFALGTLACMGTATDTGNTVSTNSSGSSSSHTSVSSSAILTSSILEQGKIDTQYVWRIDPINGDPGIIDSGTTQSYQYTLQAINDSTQSIKIIQIAYQWNFQIRDTLGQPWPGCEAILKSALTWQGQRVDVLDSSNAQGFVRLSSDHLGPHVLSLNCPGRSLHADSIYLNSSTLRLHW